MSDGFYGLKVLETQAATDAAVNLLFDVPAAHQGAFGWKAGQHVTVRFEIDGKEVRRCYSISQCPHGGEPLRITVKRHKDGIVSNHINDHVRAGDTIDVMPPFGSFCLEPEGARRTHYFFGAGSGITPLFAMITAVLQAEPHSAAYLAYGNSNADTIIFRSTLEDLASVHGERLSVRHVLSLPSFWSSMDYWRRGLIDADAVEAFINEHPPNAQDTRYYICGPGGMNGAVRAALMNLDVPASRIHMESYGGGEEPDTSFAGVPATATVTLESGAMTVPIAAGQTVLEAVRAAGGNPKYSCESGVCGACRGHLKRGEVHMRMRMALTDEEIATGAILTCQALPATPEISLSYD
jgi:ring-1,2-phenylacetyl-CoA epoxidase subunit PaaE